MAGEVNDFDTSYPKMLRQIPSPPKKLYYKGKFNKEIFENCLAVVGSRKMSPYGERVLEKIFSTLAPEITIVSGFMYGVDAEAHRKALKFGLRTIAVMPCGIDLIHPEGQKNLYEEIVSKGLILSEFDGVFEPKLWTYPRRNRIVAGLSMAVLVIEAASESGSLITARMAHSFGRDVFVVPGSIFSELNSGKVQISNEFAKTIDSGFSINKFFNLNYTGKLSEECKINNSEILNYLRSIPMTIDDLKKQFPNKDISQISTEVTLLTMNKHIVERDGVFYAC
ncbi:DNA-processing protein DprA [Patescibacteria group bacterium]|nr:DNA-processing protein DprA [Patescibacteria group bacterium]